MQPYTIEPVNVARYSQPQLFKHAYNTVRPHNTLGPTRLLHGLFDHAYFLALLLRKLFEIGRYYL